MHPTKTLLEREVLPQMLISNKTCRQPHWFSVARFAAIAIVLGLSSKSARAEDLSRTLHRAAKDAIDYCKSNEIESVGVLKFLVAKEGRFSDSVGTINSLLARRLEIALILRNDPLKPLTLIEEASLTAGKIEGASHLSRTGSQKLFSAEYDTMWGGRKVIPDALLTGVCELGKDSRTLKINLMIARREGNSLEEIGSEYIAQITPAVLTEVGESFRGGFDGGKIQTTPDEGGLPDEDPKDAARVQAAQKEKATEKVFTSVKNIREESTESHPFVDSNAAVRLQVLYDGQVVPFDIKDGRALLREPKEGQRIELRITKDATPNTYGVVVKVNGQNTLRKQVLPDASCGKWILSKPNQTFSITGYQMSQTEREEFRVLSSAESKSREVDYGDEVGTLSVTVFAEGKTQSLELDEDEREAKLVEAARVPEEPSTSFNALKAKLLADANRGLIAEGNRVEASVRVVEFQASEIPLMSATATYYQP